MENGRVTIKDKTCDLCGAITIKNLDNKKIDISNYAQVAYRMIRKNKIQRLIAGVCSICFYTGAAFDARNFQTIERGVIKGWEKEIERTKDSEEKKNQFRNNFYIFKIIGVFPENGKKEPLKA